MIPLRRPLACCLFVAALCSVTVHAQGDATQPQLPEDQRAYRAAMSIADPAQRLTALRAFSVNFQDSKYFDSVQDAALRLLLRYYPARSAEIRDQVQVNVANADKGYQRWLQQSTEADLLAEAGVQLPLAQKLAEDAARNLTEAAFLRGMARMYGELQAEMPTPTELHGQFLDARASTLLALAHVYMRQGKAPAASVLLDQAATLQPRSALLHALRGELALAERHPDQALQELEQAQVLGELSAQQHSSLITLYREAHNGSDAGLEADLDQRYAELNPAPFTPAQRTTITAGHTALLELFTGSSCLPCVGADLAVEAMLQAYRPSEMVVLEWDEHVPQPDPLANAASVARADALGAGNTPIWFLDGKRMAVYGGTRDAAADIYKGVARLADIQLQRESGVALQLTAAMGPDGEIHAEATLHAAETAALQGVTADELAPWPGDSIAAAERSHTDAAYPPELVINFALVEDNVRYSGENGVRFHRMVVRSTSSEPAWGMPLHPGHTEVFQSVFDPAAVRQGLAEYLAHFEAGNERFGPFHFLSKDASLHPTQLGVVAWVQDTRTHRVVQAAYAPAHGTDPK